MSQKKPLVEYGDSKLIIHSVFDLSYIVHLTGLPKTICDCPSSPTFRKHK